MQRDRLVLCPGAWAPALLPEVAKVAELQVLRKVLLWYPWERADVAPPSSVWFAELPYGLFYGFPCLDGRTIKFAEHSGGDPAGDPLSLDRALGAEDRSGPERFSAEVLPSLSATPTRHETCMYTMTRDAHFAVDHYPGHDNVVFAAGFSGHGYKFMSSLGAVLCELALDGQSPSPVGFLGLERFGP